MLGVIDYNAGNIQSVKNTLEKVGIPFFVSGNPEELEKAEKILFPGVGHAKSSMEEVKKRGLDKFLKTTKKPVLGICVGMQLLFNSSEEGDTECLGIISGEVKKFDTKEVDIVPHMGWNEVSKIPSVPSSSGTEISLFNNIPDYSDFYFVHSYYCAPKNREDVIAITDYKTKSFCCAVQKENFYGVQFHPEKSGTLGQEILKNFWKMGKQFPPVIPA
jgi:glutamine amidotransferase